MASVAVLLCTYNGGRFLPAQLASIGAQSARLRGANLELHVSDDASSDDSVGIIARWRAGTGFPGALVAGPGQGHAANFLSLLCEPGIAADYYAYADQDDIWDPDKLERALDKLSQAAPGTPALYCARTRSMTESGAICGQSPHFSKPPAFRNALLQNIAGGNTMVFNNAARDLLRAAGPVDVVSHDWWTYLLLSGAGAEIIYDPEPCLSYRQHASNAVGDSLGAGARLRRYRGFLQGRNRAWISRNLAALQRSEHLLTMDNQQVLRAFAGARKGSVWQRVASLRRSGVYAQTPSAQLGLYTATLLKKI